MILSKELIASVKRAEGWRDRAYKDTEGVWTIGYGRNLQTLKIDRETGEKWLREDLEAATTDAGRFPEYNSLRSQARRDVFVELVYNMGAGSLAGFKKFLAAVREEDWAESKVQLLDSKWHTQVGARARRLADIFEKGEYENVENT